MVIGLTGGIGSGKTTVLNMFKKYNIPVYVTDIEAKKIMNTSKEVKTKIVELLGEESYVKGVLNRKYIASKVFKNKKVLKDLNNIVHPAVHKDFKSFVNFYKNADYIIYESAILFENENEHLCDKIIVVTADDEERIKRVMRRDHIKKEEVLTRMSHQWSQEKKVAKADFIIENNNSNNLEKKVKQIHNKIMQMYFL